MKYLIINFILLIYFLSSNAWNQIPRSNIDKNRAQFRNSLSFFKYAVPMVILKSSTANAVNGKISVSSLEETKAAVLIIKNARDETLKMQKLAESSDWKGIVDILNSKTFTGLENAFTILVRSDAISSEDKISLGTIKRYGIVADALIMTGGLQAELRKGGYIVGSGESRLEEPISDEEEDDSQKPALDPDEVKKYIQLSKDSLSDICRIAVPILSK